MGKFRYMEALRYPYKHYLQTMIMPGAIVYAEGFCWMVVLLIVVVIAVVAGVSMGEYFSFLPQPLTSLIAGIQEQLRPATDGILMLNTEESSNALSNADFKPGNFNFNFGGAGPFFILLWCGYEWRLYGQWQQKGMAAEPPNWGDNFWGLVKDSFKGMVFYGALRSAILFMALLPVMLFALTNWGPLLDSFREMLEAIKNNEPPPEWFLPFVLAAAVLMLLLWMLEFFMAPFFIAPLMHSAQNRTLANLFNMEKAMETGGRHYGDVLVSFLLIGATALLYVVGGVVMAFATCCIGFLLFPFLFNGALKTTAAHLLAQAYGLSPEESVVEVTPAA